MGDGMTKAEAEVHNKLDKKERRKATTHPDRRPIRNARPAVGRNDPCPCGRGKKFKACCGGRTGMIEAIGGKEFAGTCEGARVQGSIWRDGTRRLNRNITPRAHIDPSG